MIEPSTSRRWLPRVVKVMLRPDITIGLMLIASLLCKIILMRPAAGGPIALAVAHHDAAILAFIVLLYCLANTLHSGSDDGRIFGGLGQGTARILAASALCLAAVYLVDVFVYYFFVTRFYLQDVVTFSSEIQAGLSLLKTGVSTFLNKPMWQLGLLGLVALHLLWSGWSLVQRPTQLHPKYRIPLTTVAVALLGFYFVPLPETVYVFGDKPLYENYIERNSDFFTKADFSPEFRRQLLDAPPQPQQCHDGQELAPNIILVIVESLSAYHSKLFSGVKDWTPRLDQIATENTALTNFYANGWTTIGGLIALLTGTFPFVPEQAEFNEWGSPRFVDFDNFTDTLPRLLAERGFETVYLGGGDTSFLGQDDWLRNIGFETIIGHDDPRFASQTVRGPFESVPDGVLYQVALDQIRSLPPDRPYFLTVQTYWSHRPFLAPDGSDAHGEETVIRYSDEQLGKLYAVLERDGFFENGLLVITGDHRAMEPFERLEFTKFGMSAPARIPAVVATGAVQLPNRIDAGYQQADLQSSVASLVSARYCLPPHRGNFLAESGIAPACVMHGRGDDRDLIYVKCGDQEGLVRVSGDETALESGAIHSAASVIDTINRTRVRNRR